MANYNLEQVMSVINYIEAHLTEKLDLNRLANASHYSKYHLHRMFTGAIGLTLHEYLQRRQLTEAAKLLVFSDKTILEIALIAGYESQQAFTNVFTAMYKTPPNKYRENEKFYPLQLKFNLEGSQEMLSTEKNTWKIELAAEDDIPCWMVLARLVVSGFPYWNEAEYLGVLQQKIYEGQALILKDGSTAIGIMIFTYETGSIDFMGCHPLYRNRGIPKALLKRAMSELVEGKEITITTYREGDRADTGQRGEIKGLGFAEGELLIEYGYPTQRFVLKEDSNE